MKKTKKQKTIELEAELVRLNSLVRDRRRELARLTKCPNKACTCRLFWQQHVEKILALQLGKIRRGIHPRPRTATAAGRRGRSRKKK